MWPRDLPTEFRAECEAFVDAVQVLATKRGYPTLTQNERELMVLLVADLYRRTLCKFKINHPAGNTINTLMHDLVRASEFAQIFAVVMAEQFKSIEYRLLVVNNREVIGFQRPPSSWQYRLGMSAFIFKEQQSAKRELSARGNALEWPTEKYNDSPERKFNKRFAIIRFLRRVWKPFLDQTNAKVTLAILAEKDPNAGNALYSYLSRRPMPDDLKILTSAQLKKELSDGPKTLHDVETPSEPATQSDQPRPLPDNQRVSRVRRNPDVI